MNMKFGALLALALGAAVTAQALEPPSPREAALNGVWQLATPVGKALRTADGKAPPLLPAAQKLYDERKAMLAKHDTSFDPTYRCKPMGFPRSLWDGAPFDLQLQPTLVFMGFTWNRQHRALDFAAKLPPYQGPRYFGTAVAHWEGDVLVVESEGYNDPTLLDSSGLPHAENMHLLERYSSAQGGKELDVRLTITDPANYSKPWDVALKYTRVPGGRILEDVCEDRLGLYKDVRTIPD